MIPKAKKQCRRASKNFYDMLKPATMKHVPKKILKHISNCAYCLEKLAELQSYMSDSAVPGQTIEPSRQPIITQLKRQFALLDEMVDCQIVKGFLPLLAEPELKTTIPTPITVHLDECEQCSKDYSTLQSLNLSSKQLTRLAEIYSRPGFHNSDECQDVHNSIELIAAMRFNEAASGAFEHLCRCRDCREHLYNTRQKIIKKLAKVSYPRCAELENHHFIDCCIFSEELYSEDRAEIIEHFSFCPVCLEKIQQLHNTIYDIADRANSGVITCYEIAPVLCDMDKPNAPVDCAAAKRFLPDFADDELKMMVPGTITAHVEQCYQCRHDIETLRGLPLISKQLTRLKSMFDARPAQSDVTCSQAQESVESFVAMDFAEIDRDVLRHLCICSYCRNLVYQQRQELIAELPEPVMTLMYFHCEDIGPIDIFNYCFPLAPEPTQQYFIQLREEFVSHLTECPQCLAKMQWLHKTISAIAERPNSGVLTESGTVVPAEKPGFLNLDHQYANYPIRVWIQSGAEAGVQKAAETEYADYVKAGASISTGITALPRKLKEKAAAINLKKLKIPISARSRYAVAASILIIAGIFLYFSFSTPTAMAAELKQIYRSVEKAKNVFIALFAPDKTEPAQELWISQTLDIQMTKTGNELVLLDINNNIVTTKQSGIASLETIELTGEMRTNLEKKISGSGYYGIMPFEKFSAIPKESQWQQVPDENLETAIADTKVYELSWKQNTGGGEVEIRKWRGYIIDIDDELKLPVRVEEWRKLPEDTEFHLKTIIKIDYPSPAEIKVIIEQAGL